MRHRRGFSFVEIMFSVVILGMGCIMVASVFPVAIQQTMSTADEAAAAQLARDAMHVIRANTTADLYANKVGGSLSFASVTPLWDKISSSVISQADSRYAWVPYFYQRSDGVVVITIVVVRRVTHGAYTTADTIATGELIPRGVPVSNYTVLADGTTTIDIQKNPDADQSVAPAYQSIARDTFLVLTSNGKVVRIGDKVSESADTVTWALQPGYPLSADDLVGLTSANVIGCDWIDPANPASGYDGPAQDVAVFTSLFQP